MKKVAILGGGMAGLAAAWSLSGPKCRDQFEVTVYQRGWRLGGKGASSRGVNGRIEEHGLHVWLGYYENAFRLIRQVYDEIDRPVSDPGCPISGFAQAFSPADRVGIGDQSDGVWSHWLATFTPNGDKPGTSKSADPAKSVTVFIRRALTLLLDFAASLPGSEAAKYPTVVLSGSPEPPAESAVSATDRVIRQAEIGVLVGALEALRMVGSVDAGQNSPTSMILGRLKVLQDDIAGRLAQNADSRRTWALVDLIATSIRGAISDQLLMNPVGLAAIDHLDLRAWLRIHGAAAETCNSSLIKGLYDLAFAYEGGDFAKPSFAAGQGLFLAGKLFFDYSGSIFWHMRAGMGDIVFAPLYQALKMRGVRFEFFHRVHGIHLDDSKQNVASVTMMRQASLLRDGSEYEPLVQFSGLPCFPNRPIENQLSGPVSVDVENHWADRTHERERRLKAGVDFDAVVLAVSVGMIPYICPELLAGSSQWRDMVSRIATVSTQSLQLWLRPTEQWLGWPHCGTTVSGYDPPFDTYASMSHVIQHEGWPVGDRPGSVAYFCSALTDVGTCGPETASKIVQSNAVDFLSQRVGFFWPAATDVNGAFRWELLHGSAAVGLDERLLTQYWQANTDPSDRYVQSVPGSAACRLRADEAGYEDLFLAGDWINNGHNGGCIEAAVMSGMQAANAVRGRPLMKGILGNYHLAP